MAICIYRISDGSLYSWSPDDNAIVASDEDLALRGLAKVTGVYALDSTHAWDAATHTVVVVVAPTPLRYMSVFDWINRFTGAELAAIRASSNNGVQKFVFMLSLAVSQTIDLNSPTIVQVMALLVSQGLLTQVRSDAIMAA